MRIPLDGVDHNLISQLIADKKLDIHRRSCRPQSSPDEMPETFSYSTTSASNSGSRAYRILKTATICELMSLLAFELVVTRYMTLENVGRDAMVVPDKLVGQSSTGKLGLRLREDRLFRPSVHGDRQRIARERDLDRSGVSTVNPLVDADIFRQDFGSHLHRGFLRVRGLADPMLLPVVGTFIADGFHHFRVGSQSRAESKCPSLVVSVGIIERHCHFQVA